MSVALFACATPLFAQTLPVPVLPPEPAAPAAEWADVPGPARPRSWEYALGVGVSWDSNIDFLVPEGPSGMALSPQGGLARVFSSPHAQWRATAAGGWTGYPEHPALRRYSADLGLDGTWRPSPNTSWRANASYGLGYSDTSRILLEQGIALPVVKTRSQTAALELSQRIGLRTSLKLSSRFLRTEFDTPGLVDGESLRGSAALERQLGPRSTGALTYSVEYVPTGPGGSYLTHFGSLQWSRVISLRSAFLVEGGGSYAPDAERAGLDRKASVFGGASFVRQVRRSSLTAFLRREVTPAFGTGTSRLEWRAGLGADVSLGRAWDLRMAARHVRPETAGGGPLAAAGVTPLDGARPVTPILTTSDDAFIGLGRRLAGRLEISGEARYRRRGPAGTLPSIETFQAGLFLTLLSPSGRALASNGL